MITPFMIMLRKFAIITGGDFMRIPYTSQHVTPAINIINIPIEMSFVCFVFIILINWGTKQLVVRVAAIYPNIFTIFINKF